MGEFHAGDGAGNADRQQAVMIRVIADIAVFIEIHGSGRGKRCFFPEIERRRLTIRAVVDEKAAATDVTARGPGNGLRKCRCDGRIDRVATLFQDLDASRGRDCRR